MEFSRPEYWSGEPFSSPGDLSNPGIKPWSPALQTDSLPVEAQGKPPMTINAYRNLRFQHFHGHLQLDQHGIASKRNRQTSKALVNEPFTVLQKSSKKIERYNYIKLSKLHLSFLYPSLPKFSYSLAASLNLPFCNFSPKIYKLYTKTFLKNISIISF